MKVSSSYRVLEAAALVHREMHSGNHSLDYAIGQVADRMVLTAVEWADLRARFEGETKEKIKAETNGIHNNLLIMRGIVTAIVLGVFATLI